MRLTVASKKEKVIMIEAGCNEIPEAKMIDAIYKAHEINQTIIEFINKIVAEVGKPKLNIELRHAPEALEAAVKEYSEDKIASIFATFDRQEREVIEESVTKEIMDHFAEIYPGRM